MFMKEIVVKVEVPEEFDEEWFRREIEEFSRERIRKLVLLNAWNKLMKGAKNLEEEEIIELSREIKRGVLKKLKERGFL